MKEARENNLVGSCNGRVKCWRPRPPATRVSTSTILRARTSAEVICLDGVTRANEWFLYDWCHQRLRSVWSAYTVRFVVLILLRPSDNQLELCRTLGKIFGQRVACTVIRKSGFCENMRHCSLLSCSHIQTGLKLVAILLRLLALRCLGDRGSD